MPSLVGSEMCIRDSNIGEEPLDEEGNPIEIENNIEFTHFKGGKGYYPGMLIRQIN